MTTKSISFRDFDHNEIPNPEHLEHLINMINTEIINNSRRDQCISYRFCILELLLFVFTEVYEQKNDVTYTYADEDSYIINI